MKKFMLFFSIFIILAIFLLKFDFNRAFKDEAYTQIKGEGKLGPSRHAYAPIPDAMHKRKSVRPALRKEVTSITLRGIDVSIRYFADRK